jgi:ribosomal protein L37AE/L43A
MGTSLLRPCGVPGSRPSVAMSTHRRLHEMTSEMRPLWSCPNCGRQFANRNQSHTCQPLGSLERHFAGKSPAVRETYDRLIAAVERIGPFSVLPEKTRIALHVRMSFAALMPRQRWLDGHVVLARRLPSPRFRRVDVYSRHNVVHAFRLSSPGEVDDVVEAWLREAYTVGEQRHLSRPRSGQPASSTT